MPFRFCVTHQQRADYWYEESEWCWQGAELRVHGRWPSDARCEVVWHHEAAHNTGKDEA